jgi:hypothetical protein
VWGWVDSSRGGFDEVVAHCQFLILRKVLAVTADVLAVLDQLVLQLFAEVRRRLLQPWHQRSGTTMIESKGQAGAPVLG